MSLTFGLALTALVASIFLLAGGASRVLAAIALVASGLEVARALGWVHLSVAGIPLALVLGLCLAIPGLIVWLRSGGKTTVAAATLVSFVGVIQTLSSLGFRV
jgi:hypothetical protein